MASLLSSNQVVTATLTSEEDKDKANDEESKVELPRLFIRLFNYEPILPLKHLKASQYGRSSASCVMQYEPVLHTCTASMVS